MLSIALYLLSHAMLLSLHLSGGSFPRPLSAQEEKTLVPVITWAGQAALEIMQHGCQAAANLFNGKTQ